MSIHKKYLEFRNSNIQTIGQIAIDALFLNFNKARAWARFKNGVWIEKLEHLFKPFFHLKHRTSWFELELFVLTSTISQNSLICQYFSILPSRKIWKTRLPRLLPVRRHLCCCFCTHFWFSAHLLTFLRQCCTTYHRTFTFRFCFVFHWISLFF